MVLGGAVTKLETFVWIFIHVSRIIIWSLFNLEHQPGQITNLKMTFYLVYIWNSPQIPTQLRNGQWKQFRPH